MCREISTTTPLARSEQIPAEFDVHIFDHDDMPTGAVGIGIPTVAPAISNGIFAVSYIRFRRLPIRDQLRRAVA